MRDRTRVQKAGVQGLVAWNPSEAEYFSISIFNIDLREIHTFLKLWGH